MRTLRVQKCGVRTARSEKKAQAPLTGCEKPARDALAWSGDGCESLKVIAVGQFGFDHELEIFDAEIAHLVFVCGASECLGDALKIDIDETLFVGFGIEDVAVCQDSSMRSWK